MKISDIPLWIKQVIYLKLAEEMRSYACEDFLREHPKELFSTFVPTLTFKGETELTERKCGLDNNIYNFLQGCADNQCLLEISINTFHSMEEIAKYYEFCMDQNFVKTPESKELLAMAGFISSKYRTGEYFKQNGSIIMGQLQEAIMTHDAMAHSNNPKKFGENLIELGFITKEDLKAVLTLKDEAKKRFILDYNVIPNTKSTYVNDEQKNIAEIENLKKENLQLRRKMIQLLALIKNNQS